MSTCIVQHKMTQLEVLLSPLTGGKKKGKKGYVPVTKDAAHSERMAGQFAQLRQTLGKAAIKPQKAAVEGVKNREPAAPATPREGVSAEDSAKGQADFLAALERLKKRG